MGKVSIVSAKYIVHATILIEGVVDRPDVIGAIFGQTEGLLGSELELRELQRSGRIGRIEVNVDVKTGRTQGSIIIPSSLDKAETSIVGAALEIIQRIGPCNAKIKVTHIEDVRVSKRSFVIERAKELLKTMTETVLPDSQDLTDEVAYSVRVMEIQEYGKDRLASGPSIDDSDEIIVVEGRADVLNLLKHGIKNSIAMNGTSVPQTIIELSKKKVITAFVDGDRGGNLILKQLTIVADIDYVTRAPDGKEVEEITKKEIHKALRSRISGEQAKLELSRDLEKTADFRRHQPPQQQSFQRRPPVRNQPSAAPSTGAAPSPSSAPPPAPRSFSQKFVKKTVVVTPEEKKVFSTMLESLVGTRGAHVLDEKLNILGKVPVSELQATITSLGKGILAIVFDGVIDRDIAKTAERTGIKYLVGMDSKIKANETKVNILTVNEL